jgi:hypothetical protein
VDDDLHIADVGKGIERHALHAPQARNQQQSRSHENKERVARTPRNDA